MAAQAAIHASVSKLFGKVREVAQPSCYFNGKFVETCVDGRLRGHDELYDRTPV